MQDKLNCITVNFDRTQHGIYVIQISLEYIYKQLQNSSLMGIQTFHVVHFDQRLGAAHSKCWSK